MPNKNSHCYRCMFKLENNQKFCPICKKEIDNEKFLKYALTPGTYLSERYLVGHMFAKDNKTLTYIGLDEHLESKIAINELFPQKIVERVENEVVVKNYDEKENFENIKINYIKLYQNLMRIRVLPNIIKIYGIIKQNNTIYIIREIVKSISFTKYLSNNYGEISWEYSQKMFLDLIKLLKYLHNNKIIHGNLNPNSLFVENNTLKIVDFSNAKFSNEYDGYNVTLNDGYSAPEQYDNKTIGTYTDVYSVAAILYKSLTGTKPVNSKSRLSNDNLLPPNILNPKIPKNVSFAIMSALILAPKLRTQTMKDFYEDLTAPPRENKHHINVNLKVKNNQHKINKKTKPKKNLKNDKKIEQDKKKSKTKNIIFLSFLISCSVVSFFLVLTIFFLFNNDMFE